MQLSWLYLFKVNNQLKYYQGRVWFTGTKSDKLKDVPMGRNTISKVPHDIAAQPCQPFSLHVSQLQEDICHQRCDTAVSAPPR
jgi:hypothetical protein